MENSMKAICLTPNEGIKIRQVPQPQKAEPDHLLIKIKACAINPGDKAFIGGTFPIGIVLSKYNIYGASGVGTVLEVGTGVPAAFGGRNVMIYRSLVPSDHIIGTWCEYAQVHYLDCAILPDNVNMDDYPGSLVNIITPYAFMKQIAEDGHKGIISTAGTSATGLAMLAICQVNNIPHISITRNAAGKKELESFGAKHILIQNEPDFKSQLKAFAQELSTTAVFDGTGGALITDLINIVPNNSTFYAYGFLGGPVPVSFHTSALMRGITFRGFSNFRSATVQNHRELEEAMQAISAMIAMPHFKTRIGKKFKFDEIGEALAWQSADGTRPVLYPFD